MASVRVWIVSSAAVVCSVCALGTASAAAATAPIAGASSQNAIIATNHAAACVVPAGDPAPRQPIGY